MFDRFFNRNNANATRGFSAEGSQRACAGTHSENKTSLILSLDTALAVSIFVVLSLALIIIRLISIIVLISVLISVICVLTLVIIGRRMRTRPRLATES